MELRQLEYFCRIVESGSIHEAARRLNMSQPPLSYQLKQLEQELHTALLMRTSKGVALTEAGQMLYQRACSLLEYARSTSREVSEAGKKRVLRLGITSTTVPTILPDIARFVHAHPDVNFEVHDGTTFTLLQLLLDGIIDVSVARTPLRLENVEYMQLSTEPMIAAFPPDSRVEKEGVLGLRHLLGRPLILYRRYERLILEEFSRQNIHPDVFCVCDDARDAMLWVKAGLATAIFPQSMHSLCTGLRIQPLEETALETQTVLIWKKADRFHRWYKIFYRFVKHIIKKREKERARCICSAPSLLSGCLKIRQMPCSRCNNP